MERRLILGWLIKMKSMSKLFFISFPQECDSLCDVAQWKGVLHAIDPLHDLQPGKKHKEK